MEGSIFNKDELQRNVKAIERRIFLKSPVKKLLERVEFEIERISYQNAENNVMLTLLTPLRNELHKMDKRKDKIDVSSAKDITSRRLKILEKEVKRAVRILKKAPMTKRFKFLKKIQRDLKDALLQNPEQTEIERIVELEKSMGETLSAFQNSKLGVRAHLLKEITRNFETALVAK
jgi:hypothetical protein